MNHENNIEFLALAIAPDRKGPFWRECYGIFHLRYGDEDRYPHDSDCHTCSGSGRVPAISQDMPISVLLELMRWWGHGIRHINDRHSVAIAWADGINGQEVPDDWFECLIYVLAETHRVQMAEGKEFEI